MRVEDILNESFEIYKKQFAIFIVSAVIAAIGSILIITAKENLEFSIILGIVLIVINGIGGAIGWVDS